jgi:hypothetical protein
MRVNNVLHERIRKEAINGGWISISKNLYHRAWRAVAPKSPTSE